MAGHAFKDQNGATGFLDYADFEGRARVGGRAWRWEYSSHSGPLFLRADGMPRENQNVPKPVLRAFVRWCRRVGV